MSSNGKLTFRRKTNLSMDSLQIKKDLNESEDSMDILRQARQAVRLADQKSDILQYYTTQQLMQRLKDLKYWSKELERELQELNYEMGILMTWRDNLDQAIYITRDAYKVNEDSLTVRKQLILDTKLGFSDNDRVEQELWNERNFIENVLKYFNKLMSQINSQAEQIKSTKARLLKDWNQKQEAVQLDSKSAMLPGDVQSLSQQAYESKPMDGLLYHHKEWLKNTQAAINQSSKDRTNTKKLVQVITTKLRESAQGLRGRASLVESSLKEHIKQLTQKSQSHGGVMKGQEKELQQIDTAIQELSISLEHKQEPLKVALTRYENRVHRPGMELCDDRAQQALNNEINNLKSSISILHNQLDKAETLKKNIQGNKTKASKLQSTAFENLKVELDLMKTIRAQYPAAIQITGFGKKIIKKYSD